MDNYILNKIENKLSQLRFQAQLKYWNEKEVFYSSHPVLLSLENEKRFIASDFKKSKEEKSKALEQIESKISVYLNENKLVVPSISYNCQICNDTGYVESDNKKERCSCFTKMLIDEAMKDERADLFNTFEDFNENIFDAATKKQMLEICEYFKLYAKKFPNVKMPNTILHGNTGTGKTFLLSCLYSELKKAGVAVVFITAGKLFDYLKKYAFNQISDIDVLIEADLLIIDDLGTEPLFNNITVEYLFMLINERNRNKKPFCISTNFNTDELKARYTERISSRLFDRSTTNIIYVPGVDLRTRF